MHIDAINEIAKGLTDEQEDTLLTHAAVSVSKALEGADDETARKHVSSFLCLLRANEPELFENGSIEMPDSTLEKDADGEDSWQSHLKGLMHDQGHHYFGELEKHYWGEMGTGPGRMDRRGYGPLGAKNPKKSPTHSYKKPQEVHGRGSGKRTLMGYIRAYAKKHGDEDVPKWNEMKTMEHEEVIQIADRLGVLVETRGPTLRVVDTDGKPNEEGENKLRGRDIANYVGAPKRGQGKNVTQDSAQRHIDHIERENDKLDGMGRKKPDISDEERRVGIKRRKKLTAKEKLIDVGRRRYGAYDPNETRDKQPVHNRSTSAAEQKRMREQQQRTRAVSPKVHERDLPDAPQTTKQPSLPDPNDAGEAIDRNKRKTVNARLKDVARREKAKLPAGERPRQGSKFSQQMEDADESGKLKMFEETVRRHKRLADQVKRLEEQGKPVPNPLRVRASKANIQRIKARANLKGQGVDRNKIDRLQRAIQQGKPADGQRERIGRDLANRGGWSNVEGSARAIVEEIGRDAFATDGIREKYEQMGVEVPYAPVNGGTWSGDTLDDMREVRTSGYYASEKGGEKVFDQKPTPEQIQEYLTENKDKLKGKYFGVWEDAGKWYLDVTHHFEDAEEARLFARENGQLAAWKISNNIMGGAETTPKMPDGLTDDVNPERAAEYAEAGRRGDATAAEHHDAMEAFDSAFAFNQTPDVQAKKLYDAEREFITGSAGGPITSRAALQQRADEMTSSDWWKKTFPETPKIVISDETPENPAAAANARRSEVKLKFKGTPKYMTEGVLIHEMAHVVTSYLVGGHGPEYAANYLAIMEEFRGKDVADKIRAAFDRDGVKVSDKAPGHFNPPKEKRGELNELIRLRSRVNISLERALQNGDTDLVSKLRQDRKKLSDQIEALGDHTAQVTSAKTKLKQQADRLSANTRGKSDRLSAAPQRTTGTSKGRKHVDYEWMSDSSILDTPDQRRAKESYSVRFVQAKDGNGWMATVMINGRPIKGTSPTRSEKNTAKAARDLLRAAGAGS